jgi:hypothetical protein
VSIGWKSAGAATTIWSTPVQIPVTGVGGNGTNQLTSIVCVDATDCTAFGSNSAGAPFSLNETAGVWGLPNGAWSAPSASGFGVGTLTNISCVDAMDCTAVGTKGPFVRGQVQAYATVVTITDFSPDSITEIPQGLIGVVGLFGV